MGSIYLARDPKIGNRLVVLKVLREGFDNPEMRERLAREANAAGALRHPNIVTIFDVGEYDGQPFIAMEYINGETLSELIKRRANLPLGRRLQLMEELCAGLHYAHRAGLVHRDIKPANIMIDEEGLLKIVDFGIARLRAGTGVTRTGTVVGTLNYMAPEQLTAKRVDARADVFSFGAVLYEVISYRRAFVGDFPSIIQTILTVNFEPLGALVPGLDPAIEAIVGSCLAKDPRDRCGDLETVRRQLAALRQRMAVEDHARDQEHLKGWLTEARADIDGARWTTAAQMVDRILEVDPLSPEARALRRLIDDSRHRPEDEEDTRDSAIPMATSLPTGGPRPAGRRNLRMIAAAGAVLAIAVVGWVWTRSGSQSEAPAVPRFGAPAASPARGSDGAAGAGSGRGLASDSGNSGAPESQRGTAPSNVEPSNAAATLAPRPAQGRGQSGQIGNASPVVSTGPANAVPVPSPQNDATSGREVDLADRYTRARNALDGGEFATAISILEGIQRDDANYRDVVVLLTRAHQQLAALARRALDNGMRLELSGDLLGAVDQFQRSRDTDPSVAAEATESINRVRARMTMEGTEAFSRARQFDFQRRVGQAIAEYDRAFRYLPDTDPNKQVAKARLDALRAEQ